jgi:hypothetical protein
MQSHHRKTRVTSYCDSHPFLSMWKCVLCSYMTFYPRRQQSQFLLFCKPCPRHTGSALYIILTYDGGLKSLRLYKENKLWGWKKCTYSTYSPWVPHTYDFVVLTCLTYPRKILLVVLQIGKAEDLSAALCILLHLQIENNQNLSNFTHPNDLYLLIYHFK